MNRPALALVAITRHTGNNKSQSAPFTFMGGS